MLRCFWDLLSLKTDKLLKFACLIRNLQSVKAAVPVSLWINFP